VSSRCSKLLVLIIGAIPVCALAAMPLDRLSRAEMAPTMEITSGIYMSVPLKSWPVDTKSFIEQHTAAASKGNLKAATDRATVYRPIPVCRLIDTRGFPAFITIPGPLLAGSNTNVNTNGACGIPGAGVAGLSVAVTVANMTPNNGGFITLLQQGAPVNGVTAVFNTGATWTASTSNISIPDDSGNFMIHIDQSNVQVIIDVNGYYQDLDFVDTGSQELDIHGIVSAGPGSKVFEVTNEGDGAALAASNLGGGPAFRIDSGSFAVAGAGIGSGTTAFVMEVNTALFGSGGNLCSGQPSIAVIDHPMLNGDPSALLLITAREGAPASIGTAPAGSAGPVAAVYLGGASCAPNHWAVRDKTGASLVNHSQYSVFIIKAQ
jgi:hypothetical protein